MSQSANTSKQKHNSAAIADAVLKDEVKDLNFDFTQERDYIAKRFGYKPWEIEFDLFHPTGEICIFVGNVWMGYVNEELARQMEDFFNKQT